MNRNDVRQFKLTTGCEIICNVVEWPEEDEVDIVVKHAFEIATSRVVTAASEEGYRYYSFKPWMALQEGEGIFLTININHVVAEALPSQKMLSYYTNAVDQYTAAIDDDPEAASQSEEWVNRLKEAVAALENISGDSDSLNVISFPKNKNKYH